ncbi:MAG TPA: MFS transporter [Candidatus Binatia bacterium]|nr:MFS transporter [Candidatus Binatia bacterium]
MTDAPSSAWGPLRQPLFRAVWLAAVVSNVGTWMHDTSAAWLMTSLSTSPLVVALMQTAMSLPFFLLALPAGALADVVDRRRVLLVTQTWMLVAALALGMLALSGRTTPWSLLGLTFALGLGAAMNAPAWQAITPELVAREDLAPAVALNGVAVNVARAVGPALGGLLVAVISPGGVFLLNAASFVGVIAVLGAWRRAPSEGGAPAERVVGAILAGVRYVRHAAPVRTVLVRSAAFVVSASGVWALLPLVARQGLGLGAVGYGLLLGCLGAGALVGAAALPGLRRRLGVERLLAAATGVFAGASATLGVVRVAPLAGVALLGAGVAWMTTMSSLLVAAQTAVPGWVRARALAVTFLVLQGGLAAGSLLWGTVATHAGVPTALMAAAGGLVLGLAVAPGHRIAGIEALDLTPAARWPLPDAVGVEDLDEGPVLVTVEYRIDPARSAEYARAMRDLARVRRRDGAVEWGLFRDAAEPARYLETFLVDSWAEHLRQHARVTAVDRAVQERAAAFHLGPGRPLVTHLIAAR